MNFHDFASAHGLIIHDLVCGRIARCSTISKPHHKNGAYLFYGDWGWIQDHALHTEIVLWKSDKVIDQADLAKRMAESRKAYTKERLAKQQEAARKAKWILSQCELEKHAYMDKKGFPDMRVNVWRKPDTGPIMVVPMRVKNNICGVQLISIFGDKKFLTGSRTNDAVFSLSNGGEQVYMTEGFASALSLQAILAALKLRYSILATFSAGNMKRLAVTHPDAILICDHDISGTGQKVGQESGNRWWMPEQEGWDINDVFIAKGLFRASQLLRSALK